MGRRARRVWLFARPFDQFVEAEALGGLILLVSSVAALALANSPWRDAYHRLWAVPLSIGVGGQTLSLTLHQWINDGLMTLFFLLVGLEIKRELLAGELTSRRHAVLPMAGALGGMLLPAAVYLAFNPGGMDARGWGIPVATDIAFALGALSLIAPALPVGAKVFLTALAIVDDMGAVAVIAIFYTQTLHMFALVFAAVTVAALVLLNAARVIRLTPYLLLGAVLWLCVHASGVHSTIAGVLLAFAIPTRTRINAAEFSKEARDRLDEFDRTETGDLLVLTSKGQQNALFALGHASDAVSAPLLRLEHALHGVSAYAIMPLFAFANAGVTIAGSAPHWRVLLGVAFGLILGKSIGITLGARSAVAAGVAALPRQVTSRALYGCAWLGGIGFTMALFISNLAFGGTNLLDSAKIGILAGSFVSGAGAAIILSGASTAANDTPGDDD